MFVVWSLMVWVGVSAGGGSLSTAFAQTCGNGVCDAGETKQSCPQDCRRLLKLLRERRGSADRAGSQPKAVTLGPGDTQGTLTVDGRARTYLLHAPPGYDGRTAVAVVIVLHGGGGTAGAVRKETGWAKKADEAGFLAVFPEGTSPNPSSPSRFTGNPQTWNDGSGRFHSGQRNIDDVGFVNALLDDLLAKWAIDPKRVFVTGFSNGASMTYRLGVELSSRIAAIAPVSGHLWIKHPKLDQPVSIVFLIGTADPLNPLEGGDVRLPSGRVEWHPPVQDSIRKWVAMNGCSPEPKTIDDQNGVKGIAYEACREGSEVAFYTIEGMGHAWPGGKNLLPERMVGKASDKINATDVIWEFFKRHPRK